MIYKAEVITYSEKRKFPILAGYRPHLALKHTDELLGVEFLEVTDDVLDQYTECIIKTSYNNVDYSILKINETYDVREGKNVVGEIVLKEILED